MFKFLPLCLLLASTLAQDLPDHYSFSVPVGSGTGTGFVTSGEGRITALRVWELNNNQLVGFQVKFGFSWAPIVGRSSNDRVEMILFDGEAIIQVSGKFNPSNFVEQVIFVTNRGRFLMAGQPTGLTFNHYPTSSESELLLLSGRFNNGGITSLGAHWGRPGQAVHPPSSNSSDLSALP